MNQPQTYIASFWRRSGAFIIDAFIFFLISCCFALIFENYLLHHPVFSICLGYLVAISFFGFLNSHFHQGQTLGKMLFKIQVVHLNGTFLSFKQSFIRSSIYLFPICLLSAAFFPYASTYFTLIIYLLITTIIAVLLYFLIFNQSNHRNIHDLMMHTIVVHKNVQATHIPQTWEIHYYFVGILCLALLPHTVRELHANYEASELQDIAIHIQQQHHEIQHIQALLTPRLNQHFLIETPKQIHYNITALELTEVNTKQLQQEIVAELKHSHLNLKRFDREVIFHINKSYQFGFFYSEEQLNTQDIYLAQASLKQQYSY